jgi:hypothetical protein
VGKLALALLAWCAGFSHISDDDFSRTVIAATFAHAPKLDPSGTSWLPFPFWSVGAVMLVFGRTIAVARITHALLAAVAQALLFVAARGAGASQRRALLMSALCMLLPWSIWLSSAAVPEAFVPAAVAAAMLGLRPSKPPSWWQVALLVMASLSRYEVWPFCAVFAVACVERARRSQIYRTAHLASGAATMSGIVAWLLHNWRAHGNALHFLARVTRFRQAEGHLTDLQDRLLYYPRALFIESPELGLALLLACGVWMRAARRARPPVGVPWPVASAVAGLAYLVYGSLTDGAPTHHGARAALPAIYTLIAAASCAGDSEDASERARRPRAFLIATMAGLVLLVVNALSWPRHPGQGQADRREQLARGAALRGTPGLIVTPCAYEHFALIAAYGAPERVTTLPKATPAKQNVRTNADCPLVETTREQHRD